MNLYHIIPSSSSVTNNSGPHQQIWKPSFSFHFTAISTIKRYYQRFIHFFVKQPQPTLPYYNPVPTTESRSSSILNYLSQEGTSNESSYNTSTHTHSSVIDTASNWFSYYWRRIFWGKTPKESD